MPSGFRIGDKVRVKEDYPSSHPRYKIARGWIGVITVIHGSIENPKERGGLSPPIYTVVFDKPDNVKIWFDVYEDWIEQMHD